MPIRFGGQPPRGKFLRYDSLRRLLAATFSRVEQAHGALGDDGPTPPGAEGAADDSRMRRGSPCGWEQQPRATSSVVQLRKPARG